jgi:hypothetical protein
MSAHVVSSIICVLLLVVPGCDSSKTPTSGPTIDLSGSNPHYNNPTEKATADAFFAEKTIFATTPIHPLRLAGAIAWRDRLPDGQEHWQFTRLQPKLDLADAEFRNEIIFSSIVDKGFSVGVSYLAFAATSLSAEDKAEVYVERVFRALGPEYLAEGVQAEIESFKEKNKKAGREFYYVEAMQYNTIKFKQLKKVSADAKASYLVAIDGSAYSSNERFTIRDLVAVEMINVTETRGAVRPRSMGPASIRDFAEK